MRPDETKHAASEAVPCMRMATPTRLVSNFAPPHFGPQTWAGRLILKDTQGAVKPVLSKMGRTFPTNGI
jgi:hypothetical protein